MYKNPQFLYFFIQNANAFVFSFVLCACFFKIFVSWESLLVYLEFYFLISVLSISFCKEYEPCNFEIFYSTFNNILDVYFYFILKTTQVHLAIQWSELDDYCIFVIPNFNLLGIFLISCCFLIILVTLLNIQMYFILHNCVFVIF